MAVENVPVSEKKASKERARGLEEERGPAGDFSFPALDMLGFGFGVPRQPADLTLLLLCGRLGQAGAGVFKTFK